MPALPQGIKISFLQGLDDLQMLPCRIGQLLLTFKVLHHCLMKLEIHAPENPDGPGPPGALRNKKVEVKVNAAEGEDLPVFLHGARCNCEELPIKAVHPFVVSVGKKPVPDQHFEHLGLEGETDIIELLHVHRRKAEDHGSLPGDGPHEPLSLELLQGLSHRGPADIELPGQLLLADKGPLGVFR